MKQIKEIRRALISVSDKKNLDLLAKKLREYNVEIVASGKTYSYLLEKKIPALEVQNLTNYPEILGGRVKTLHPQVHGGILYQRDLPQDVEDLKKHHIVPIDLVIVNLYPFEEVRSHKESTEQHIIENIDIGGVALLRAAAKNFESVNVLHSPEQYDSFLEEFSTHQGKTSLSFRKKLAGEAFLRTQSYDQSIASWFSQGDYARETSVELSLGKVYDLRYGENPHQQAAFYLPKGTQTSLTSHLIQGKTLSYNNLLDLDHVIRVLRDFKDHQACVIVKHNNPSGFAYAETANKAFLMAKECDPVSAFGGIVGFTSEIDESTALSCAELFLEAIVAPSVHPKARAIFSKKKNLRIIELPELMTSILPKTQIKSLLEGYLIQESDVLQTNIRECKVVSKRAPSEQEWKALELSWKIVKHVKSNAIVFADESKILSIGAGQMSRIDSVNIAHQKIKTSANGPIAMASDAFFPFRDGVDVAASYGIKAIVQPGGSIRDPEVIDAANEHSIAMIFTGVRHFSH